VVIVRSTVPTRNQGFLPGSAAEKQAIYELPYKAIAKELINHPSIGDAYEKLKSQKSLEFISTSFVRGITIDNAIIVVDEFSNLNFHENDSIVTRAGNNCKIIFCGDTKQSDLHGDRLEHVKFLEILNEMKMFKIIRFGVDDIVRSGIVRQYLITKEKLGY
jgi:predicted ribonuclease YlaK